LGDDRDKKALQDHEVAAVDSLDEGGKHEGGKRLLTSPHPQSSEDIEGSTKNVEHSRRCLSLAVAGKKRMKLLAS
jgi:hypothetical protein